MFALKAIFTDGEVDVPFTVSAAASEPEEPVIPEEPEEPVTSEIPEEPVTPEIPEEPASSEVSEESVSVPRTGDSASLTLWILMLVLGIILAGYVIVKAKKQPHKD